MKKLLLLLTLISSAAQAQLSPTDAKLAREALYVAHSMGAISTEQGNLLNPPLIENGGLGLVGNPLAPAIIQKVKSVTGGVYDSALNALLTLIGSVPVQPPPVQPPPVVVVPPSPPPPTPSNGVTVIQGDLVVTGRVCVVDTRYVNDCDRSKSEIVQIRQGGVAAIGFNPNLSRGWRQGDTPNGTPPGYGLVGMSPDLGLRICQNQSWNADGTYTPWVVPEKGNMCVGGDSQGQWSFNFRAYGAPDHGTQQVVLLDLPGVGLAWTTWRVDRNLCIVTSTVKWGMDVVWCPPKPTGIRGTARPFPRDTTSRPTFWR